MKVREIEEEVFKPIEIILESEEEVELLWHSLNLPPKTLESESEDYKVPMRLVSKMWEMFDVVYRPE